MGLDWLVTLVLVVHMGYLTFLVVGGFLAWRWPKAFYAHLAACLWVVFLLSGLVNCPLTAARNWARQVAGQAPLQRGFIDQYLDDVIYPERYVPLIRLTIVAVVGVSWLGVYRRHRTRTVPRHETGTDI